MKRGGITAIILWAILSTFAKAPQLPHESVILPGYQNIDSVARRLAASPLDVIEGIWQFAADGARVAVVAMPRDLELHADYAVVAIDGADRTLRPGTIVGLINRGGERGIYRASFYKEHSLGELTLSGRREFTLNLADDRAFLRFVPRHSSIRLFLPALLPGIAGSIVRTGYLNRPSDGCSRLFPEPLIPVNPRYL